MEVSTYLRTYYTRKYNKWLVISAIVRLVQGTKIDHAGFSLENDSEDVVYEAKLWKSQKTPSKDFFKGNEPLYIFRYPLNVEEEMVVRKVIEEGINKPYSLLQLIGIMGIKIINKVFGKQLTNKLGKGLKKIICSEWLGSVLVKIGSLLPAGLDLNSIDVEDCLEMNKQLEKAIRIK